MKVSVITLFPDMFRILTEEGVVSRGIQEKRLQLELINPRDYTLDKHATVDDRPYGGGPGMVMMVEPLRAAIQAARAQARAQSVSPPHVIYVSPQGQKVDQTKIVDLAGSKNLLFVAGRYEGIDERLIEAEIDEELSIGDYVLSGGELAVMVILDAISRWLPGVVGNADSVQQDSFAAGLLDCPHYTRPKELSVGTVPELLLSGDHKAVAKWRFEQSLKRTYDRRPDLLTARELSEIERDGLRAQFEQMGSSKVDDHK